MIKDKKNLNVPPLRFPEFEGEWDSNTLKHYCNINETSINLDKIFHYIDLESVVKGELVIDKIISKENAPSRARRVLKKNNILYQTVRPYQFNNYYFNISSNEQYVASTGYAILQTEQDPRFIYHLLNTKTFNDEIMNRCTGTSYPAINSTDLGKIIINLPTNIREQNEIAKILTLLDSRITVQRKLIDNYKSLIKVINGQMYYVSKTKNFTIRDISMPIQNDKIDTLGYLEINGLDVNSGDYVITKNKDAVLGSKNGYKGNLVISTVRPTRGAISILKNNHKISSALFQIHVTKTYSIEFLRIFLRSEKVLNEFSNYCTGSTYPIISKEYIINYKIPIINESKSISKCSLIISLDRNVKNELNQITNLVNLKLFLLKNLFI